jgi:hypothetical protein
MGDKETPLSETAWEKVLSEITNPGDWVAAGTGAALGGVLSFIAHWPDWFTFAATGATVGVTLRKAWNVARNRPQLRKRALALDEIFAQLQAQVDSTVKFPANELDPYQLLQMLRREITLWEKNAASNEQFRQQLDELVNRYRLITAFLDTHKKELQTNRSSDDDDSIGKAKDCIRQN